MRRHSTPAEQWHKERGKIKERFNIEWLTDEESFPETRPFLLPLPVLSPCNSSVWLGKTPSRIPMVRVNGLPWLRRLILFGPPTHKVRPEPRQGNSWWTAQPDRQTDRRMGRHNLPTQSVAMFVPPTHSISRCVTVWSFVCSEPLTSCCFCWGGIAYLKHVHMLPIISTSSPVSCKQHGWSGGVLCFRLPPTTPDLCWEGGSWTICNAKCHGMLHHDEMEIFSYSSNKSVAAIKSFQELCKVPKQFLQRKSTRFCVCSTFSSWWLSVWWDFKEYAEGKWRIISVL